MTWESVLHALTSVDSEALMVNFDASHFFALGLDDRMALSHLSAYVVHAHLKDFRRRKPPLCDLQLDAENLEAVALGDGDFDFGRHLGELLATGFDGACSAELYVADVDDALARSAENMLPLMRQAAP